MAYSVFTLQCPHCGASVSINQAKCQWCESPVVITSFSDIFGKNDEEVKRYISEYRRLTNKTDLSVSMGICYLKLHLYKQALNYFEKLIETRCDNSEILFYAAVCCLNGKKPFLAKKENINKAQEYISAAIDMESRGIYYYFYAYVKYDYYERKSLNTQPTYKQLLDKAVKIGVSEFDKEYLRQLLNQIMVL